MADRLLTDGAGQPIPTGGESNALFNSVLFPFMRAYFRVTHAYLDDGTPPTFSPRHLDSLLKSLTDQLSSDEVTVATCGPILDLEVGAQPFELAPDVRLVPIPTEKLEEWFNHDPFTEDRIVSFETIQHMHVMLEIRRSQRASTVRGSHGGADPAFDRARTYLEFALGCGFRIPFTETQRLGLVGPSPIRLETLPMGRFAAPVVPAGEGNRIAAGWRQFSASCSGGRIPLPFRRWASAARRLDDEDALIDAWVGLEAIFARDATQECKFRVSLRAAHLLGGGDETRTQLYEELRESYDVRSVVVHGNVSALEKHNRKLPMANRSKRASDLLRRALQIWLQDSARFEGDALDATLLADDAGPHTPCPPGSHAH